MKKLKYFVIPEGDLAGKFVPVNVVYLDVKDIRAAGLTMKQAVLLAGKTVGGACGINIIDTETVTTTSDGVMAPGAIICIAAMDRGILNEDFGIQTIAEMPFSPELVKAEPHLLQWEKRYKGKKLFRGINPATKQIPVHNAVVTGRATNNNSGTEMMNVLSMEEILLPILGQIQCVRGDGQVLVGLSGEHISVGIGMTIAEKYGRIFPSRLFPAGETAHNSGVFARELKKNIPCVVADKAVVAAYTMNALEDGCVPGRELGCSPVVLSVAKHYGKPIAYERITARAWVELESVGITREFLQKKDPVLSRDEIIARADELLPGVEKAVKLPASQAAQCREVAAA